MPKKRKRRTREERLAVVTAFRASGLSLGEFARAKKMHPSTLAKWDADLPAQTGPSDAQPTAPDAQPTAPVQSRRAFLKDMVTVAAATATGNVAVRAFDRLTGSPEADVDEDTLVALLASRFQDLSSVGNDRAFLWDKIVDAGVRANDLVRHGVILAEAQKNLTRRVRDDQAQALASIWASLRQPPRLRHQFAALAASPHQATPPLGFPDRLNVLIPGPYVAEAAVFQHLTKQSRVGINVDFKAETFLSLKEPLDEQSKYDLVVCADMNVLKCPDSLEIVTCGTFLDYALLEPAEHKSEGLIALREPVPYSAGNAALASLREQSAIARALEVREVPASSSGEQLSSGTHLLSWGPLSPMYVVGGLGRSIGTTSSRVLVLAQKRTLRVAGAREYLAYLYESACRDLTAPQLTREIARELALNPKFGESFDKHVGRDFWRLAA